MEENEQPDDVSNDLLKGFDVRVGDKELTIRKSSLCWLLTNQSCKMSADRLMRFRNSQNSPVANSDHQNKYDPVIVNENYYAVYYYDNWYIGRVLEEPSPKMYVIKFLKESLDSYDWPKTDDIQNVSAEYIFFGPITMYGTKPMTISKFDKQKIVVKYKALKRKECNDK
ncbi:uncharacterized protein LOC116167612 [Photinus pyralis]|nr:uncharacterized protein LOC116167612 [Photinus pyralis]